MDSNDSDEHDASIVTVEVNELEWVKSVKHTLQKNLVVQIVRSHFSCP